MAGLDLRDVYRSIKERNEIASPVGKLQSKLSHRIDIITTKNALKQNFICI